VSIQSYNLRLAKLYSVSLSIAICQLSSVGLLLCLCCLCSCQVSVKHHYHCLKSLYHGPCPLILSHKVDISVQKLLILAYQLGVILCLVPQCVTELLYLLSESVNILLKLSVLNNKLTLGLTSVLLPIVCNINTAQG
jgi:hypothetical protein